MTTEHTELAAAPDPRPVQIVRRDLAQGQSVFRQDVAGLLAEYDRLRAVLARPAAGRDLTAQDVGDAIRQWNVVPGEPHRDAFIADYLNGIARPARPTQTAVEEVTEWRVTADIPSGDDAAEEFFFERDAVWQAVRWHDCGWHNVRMFNRRVEITRREAEWELVQRRTDDEETDRG